jgi:hypothetical protein
MSTEMQNLNLNVFEGAENRLKDQLASVKMNNVR